MDPKKIANLIAEDPDVMLEMLYAEVIDAELYKRLSRQINKINNFIYKNDKVNRDDLIDLGVIINEIPWGGSMPLELEQDIRQNVLKDIQRAYKNQGEDLNKFTHTLRHFLVSIMVDESRD